jgi:predicted transcriptional regulator
MAKGFNAKTHSVRNIMKKTMVPIESNQSLMEAREMMRTSCSRHLIVIEKGKIVGIIP